MKTTILASLMLITVVGLSACQKKDDGGGGSTETYATTPCTNTNLSTCGNGTITNYNNPYAGINFLPYQGSYASGFCGCQSGYRPIIHDTMGLNCAPNSFFRPYQNSGYPMWGYNYRVFGGAYYNSSGHYNGGYYGNNYYNGGGITSQPGQNNQWSSIPQVTYNPAVSGSNNNCYANAAATCDIRQANSCGSGVCRPTGGGTYLGICSYQRGTEGYSQANSCIQRMSNGGYINICGYGGYSYGYSNSGYGNNLPNR